MEIHYHKIVKQYKTVGNFNKINSEIRGFYEDETFKMLTGKKSNTKSLKSDYNQLLAHLYNLINNKFATLVFNEDKVKKTFPRGNHKYYGIVYHHSYSIMDAKVEDKKLKLLVRNPWGNYTGDHEETMPENGYI